MCLNQSALAVNGREFSLKDVLRLAKWQGNLSVLEGKARQVLIEQASQEMGIGAEVKELQEKADEIRKSLNLYSSSETVQWLEAHGLSIGDLEEIARYQVLAAKIRESVSEGKVERYFNENRLNFDSAIVYHLVTAEEGEARELLFQIEEGGDFFNLALEYSIDDATKLAGGFIGEVNRAVLSPQVESAVFGAEPGTVVGPVKTDQGYHLFKIQTIRKAELNDILTEQIKDFLFSKWLENTFQKANVEYPIWKAI